MAPSGHTLPLYTGMLDQAFKISMQIPQQAPWSPIITQKGVQFNSIGLGTTRAGSVYQLKMSAPILDSMSTAAQLEAVGGALVGSFLGSMIECSNGSVCMFIDNRK